MSAITHWQLNEILEMTEEEFYQWHQTAVAVHKEMVG